MHRAHACFAHLIWPFFALACVGVAPSGDADGGGGDATSSTDPLASTPFALFTNLTSIAVEGDEVVLRTQDLPDHGSPFYPMSDPRYEAYDGPNASFSTTITLPDGPSDPDIVAQDLVFRIPLHPSPATTHAATSLGAIGIARNGVVFFNQYNGMRAVLGTLELNNLDQYNGHPTPTVAGAQYHYHIEPLYLTEQFGSDAFMGFLLDGFPVYGPVENGVRLTSADLDAYHGHTHATPEYPTGIYHYHFTDDAPWLNGDGFEGTPGTVSR